MSNYEVDCWHALINSLTAHQLRIIKKLKVTIEQPHLVLWLLQVNTFHNRVHLCTKLKTQKNIK